MAKFLFSVHVWSPTIGHADKRYIMNGRDVQHAFDRLLQVLESRDDKIIVNPKTVERLP